MVPRFDPAAGQMVMNADKGTYVSYTDYKQLQINYEQTKALVFSALELFQSVASGTSADQAREILASIADAQCRSDHFAESIRTRKLEQ